MKKYQVPVHVYRSMMREPNEIFQKSTIEPVHLVPIGMAVNLYDRLIARGLTIGYGYAYQGTEYPRYCTRTF